MGIAPLNEAIPPASLVTPQLVSFVALDFLNDCRGRCLPRQHVTPRVRKGTMRRSPQMRTHTQLVPHRPAYHEKTRFFTCEVCDIGFEGEGCGVFLEDVVEESTLLRGSEHGGWGGGYGVA